MVGQLKLAPSEYWRMTPDEVWLFMEANIPEQTYGRLRQSDVDSLEERYNELSEKGVKLA